MPMSASIATTSAPERARIVAIAAVVVVFPTPPFADATAYTVVIRSGTADWYLNVGGVGGRHVPTRRFTVDIGRNPRALSQTPYTSLIEFQAISSMARPEVLDRIKEAEREADEIIATAESDADERLAEARSRADEIRAEAEEEAESEAAERIEAAREDIEERKTEILEAGRSDRDELEREARERVDSAVDYAVERFEEAVNQQAEEAVDAQA